MPGGVGFPPGQGEESEIRRILPTSLREDLIWMDAGEHASGEFRDTILEKSVGVLFSRRRGGAHAVAEAPVYSAYSAVAAAAGAALEMDFAEGITSNSMEDLVAVTSRSGEGRGEGATTRG